MNEYCILTRIFFLCVYSVENCSFFLFILGILNPEIALELLTHGKLAVLSCVALSNQFFPFAARNEIKTVRFGLNLICNVKSSLHRQDFLFRLNRTNSYWNLLYLFFIYLLEFL